MHRLSAANRFLPLVGMNVSVDGKRRLAIRTISTYRKRGRLFILREVGMFRQLQIRAFVYSVMIRSAHSTSDTKIVGLPNFAPHWLKSVSSTLLARQQAPQA